MDPAKDLLGKIHRMSVSEAIARTLRIARATKTGDLEKWCRLELAGYLKTNPALTDDVVVPVYRTVRGQHADIYGSVLQVPSDYAFVNETRMRQGVEELEGLASGQGNLSIHDPYMCEMLKEHLGVEVHYFRFSRSTLAGVLGGIRLELNDRLTGIAGTDLPAAVETAARDEIVMLKPNFQGIGVDLRALWRRLTNKG